MALRCSRLLYDSHPRLHVCTRDGHLARVLFMLDCTRYLILVLLYTITNLLAYYTRASNVFDTLPVPYR
jgi:hypothetical protein